MTKQIFAVLALVSVSMVGCGGKDVQLKTLGIVGTIRFQQEGTSTRALPFQCLFVETNEVVSAKTGVAFYDAVDAMLSKYRIAGVSVLIIDPTYWPGQGVILYITRLAELQGFRVERGTDMSHVLKEI